MSASPITTSGTPEHHTQHVDGVDGYLQLPAPAYGSLAAMATIMSITEYYLWPLGNSRDGLLAPQNDALCWQTSYISYIIIAYKAALADPKLFIAFPIQHLQNLPCPANRFCQQSSLRCYIYIWIPRTCLNHMINPHWVFPTSQKKGILPWCHGWLGLVIWSFE